ncbi:MAG TPA: hypothetical protein VHP38_00015 [Ruminiclostridium sp.]|nr:hypothetical protein [Ruminiclostridium sp.]
MARVLTNRVKLSSRLGFELTGYIGLKSTNSFVKIDYSNIKVIAAADGWNASFKFTEPFEAGFDMGIKKSNNDIVFSLKPLPAEIKNYDDIFLTLLMRDYRTNLYYTVFHGHIKLFNTRYVELPAQVTVGLEDFASGIADSIKEANQKISEKLVNNSFDLEIGDLEIKTPYITQIGSNNKLVMKMPQPADRAKTDDPVFSRINFKNIPRLK